MNWNVLDKTIAWMSPKAGMRRFDQRRSYEAATSGRRSKSFSHASSTGANLEIGMALTRLRDRSRHFVRNNGWAKRAITSISDHTIGEGIRPAPTGTRLQVKKIKDIWRSWAESTDCDWDGKNTFYGLQHLIMSEIAEAGDCLVIRRRTPESKIPIKLQVVESDQLDHSQNSANERGYARLGVQFDKSGRRIGYWVYPSHPNDSTGIYITIRSEFIPVEDILHPYEILRAGQCRGIPMGVASFIKMSDFSDYEDAQLIRQKAAAAFAAFVTGKETVGKDKIESIEPGIIQYLNEGEEITFSNPPKADGYSEYSVKILQGIAVSYGITYEMLTGDYSNVNFTSGRMAKIDVTPRFRMLQYNMIIPQVCVPVWNWFMDAVVMAGLSNTRVECNATDWTAPKVQQLDPVKETNARVLSLQAGLTTLSECVREDGRDPEEFFQELRSERQKLAEMGINLSSILLAPDNSENTDNKNGKGN